MILKRSSRNTRPLAKENKMRTIAFLVLVIFILVLSTSGHANTYSSILNQIKRNNPSVTTKKAISLAQSIAKISKQYNIPAKIYTAILMQESAYKVNAVNCSKRKCHDYGISQINIKNIEYYGFDIEKLLTDTHYSIEAGAIILSYFKNRYSKKDKYWWTRYNAGNKVKRKIYRKKVSRFL
jgi:soluble lytic murein transglycosylase-like protein